VHITGELDQRYNSALPLAANTIGEAAFLLGASTLGVTPSRRIIVGAAQTLNDEWAVSPCWDGWRAWTAKADEAVSGEGSNPLTGIAAGALAVGAAFAAEREVSTPSGLVADLWPVGPGQTAPDFVEVFLPSAVWLVGLGNLGQAYLWTLSALPYLNPADLKLILQDRDRVSEENWGTSVLVQEKNYGELKTMIGERWALAKGFDARRLDRRLLTHDRLDADDPRIALSGVDKIEARKIMAKIGFHSIIDAGLGRTYSDFNRYRVTVFDHEHPIDKHFDGQEDKAPEALPGNPAYQGLEAEIGSCGAAEIAGASVAAPFVSSFAAAVAISRLIAVTSNCECPRSEVGWVSSTVPTKRSPSVRINARGAGNAGKPSPRAR